MSDRRGTVIALLGAESTGKTVLARALAASLRTGGRRVARIAEHLREFCDDRGRTPRQDEQQRIADEQTRRIDAAAASHEIVVADTSALMIAVYSDIVFGDTTLYPAAEAAHGRCDVTLLTALDLPWRPDGLQRDGPQVREPVDRLIRAALDRAALPYAVVFGHGEARLQAALAATRHAIGLDVPPHEARTIASGNDDAAPLRWRWHCDRCGDADCERLCLARA